MDWNIYVSTTWLAWKRLKYGQDNLVISDMQEKPLSSLVTLPRVLAVLALIFLLGVILAVRAPGLNQFVTPDEAAWVGRSASFYYALAHRNYADTFQHSHPGVTATWAGTLAYRWRYPALAWEATPRILKNWMKVEPFLRDQGQEPLEILAIARLFMVIGTAIALGLAFLCVWRLLGLLPSFLGFLLIALDPFHVGLTRLLHLDGLMASLLLLVLLSFLCFLLRGKNILYLILATAATGLAFLTKSPSLVLVPFLVVLFLDEIWRLWKSKKPLRFSGVWKIAWPFLFWGIGSAVVFIAFWPAMWVDPLGTLQKMFDVTFSYAVEGHSSAIFFNGKVIDGDPGWYFYPVNYLWRTTPAVLGGLVLCLLAYFKRWRPLDDDGSRRVVIYLALFAVLFAIQMSFGAKKFDRYLIPSFLPLDLLAGVGWACLAGWGWQRAASSPVVRYALIAGLFLVIGLQAFLVVRSHPYYINYFNPIMGGSTHAPQVMMIGWGEGLDQAARYLNTFPDAEKTRVMSYYPDGSFSYFFDGKTLPLPARWDDAGLDQLSGVDFVVLYFHQWQRQVPDARLLAYFDQFDPEFVARIDGLDYARVYNLRNQALDLQIP